MAHMAAAFVLAAQLPTVSNLLLTPFCTLLNDACLGFRVVFRVDS